MRRKRPGRPHVTTVPPGGEAIARTVRAMGLGVHFGRHIKSISRVPEGVLTYQLHVYRRGNPCLRTYLGILDELATLSDVELRARIVTKMRQKTVKETDHATK
jgi:hypothetical protein